MSDEYATNIIRLIASELRLLNGMTAAREMFGKSYFSLGAGEQAAVDRMVTTMVVNSFVAMTPKYFAPSEPAVGPVGFHVDHTSAPKPDTAIPQPDAAEPDPDKTDA